LKICADEWIREFQHGSADTRRKTENKEPASYFSGMKAWICMICPPIFLRASLHCVPASQNRASTPTRENRACWGARLPPRHAKRVSGAPACWEQLRAGLRRKEGSF
jgi:hypothetical protein